MFHIDRLNPAIRLVFVVITGVASAAGVALAANVEGQLDPHFSGDGKALVDIDKIDSGNAVAVQPDGKIVVAGTLTDSFGSQEIGMARLLSNGSIDTGFGNNGKIKLSRPPDQIAIRALIIQPDGKIVIAGYYQSNDSQGRTFFAKRFNSNGSFDYNFGSNSDVRMGFGYGYSEANSIAIASDGSIYLGGDVRREYSIGGPIIQDFDFAAVKLTPSGQPDTGFGDQGRLSVAFDEGGDDMDIGNAMAIQSDGKVLLAGRVRKDSQSDEYGLVRFSADGVPDSSFGNLPSSGFNAQPGQSVFDIAGYHCHQGASALRVTEITFITTQRRIFVGGSACYLGTTTIGEVAGVQDDGTLDTSFGSSGSELVDLNSAYEAQHLTSIVLQPPPPSTVSFLVQPKLLVVGYGYSKQYGNDDMLMTRLASNGDVDTTFGLNGQQSVYFDYAQALGDDHAYAGAMYGDGYLVVAGSSQRNSDGDTDFAVARLLVGDSIFHDGFEAPL